MAPVTGSSLPAANKPFLRRNLTATAIDSDSSTVVSPVDSPRPSPSTTSLSSLASEDAAPQKKSEQYGKLIDTYGNEFEVPDFTIKEIRDAIPKHCYERSAIRSLAYVARDMIYLATTFYIWNKFVTPEYVPSQPLRVVLWGVYTFLQGLFGTGLWVLAHECGHGAFSPSQKLNNFVGWVLHSALLVPYFSWQLSHSKHHKATGHMERDMVFLPRTREQHATRIGRLAHELSELTEEAPIVTFLQLLGQQLFGWWNYLLTNVTGHDNHERQREGRGKGKKNGFGGGVNHFDPRSPLYENRDSMYILLSDLGLAIAISALIYLGKTFGWSNMFVWYFLPYLWVNHWLVAITYLQHTDPSLPHYTEEEWNFVRGAAATIDREFGFIGRHLLHGIIETHVLHHYVSTIPFYHADEATEAIKPVMGRHYRSDTRDGPVGFIKALWKSARWCQWVEPSEGAEGRGKGVLFFRNHNGLGTAPAKMPPVA
ncbi:228e8849-69f5-4b99-859c-bd9b91f096e7 [Thermothielavioides terrestris]|uniref:Bifunctional delta12/omega3 fatty acid desaturase n=2 Tax=Thermothielavioides terrestris TaxID=2587410 RepID=G2R7H4_THETT|nr:bifunctional delta12/omega3 fatty acid desaturase [Thermothielavioides terrestris NRRL 8126]AEO67883.1 bifunctional delta12/omega3 fatty acid desaturase [Thermothielavioides terrestris NRRL 8126]SPQ24890.1 228e8849-69f5-4b99-859c-bd9b91f096e7 [Thermothielavioides terrestris]